MDLLQPIYDAIEQNNWELGKVLLREATSGNNSQIYDELLHFAVYIGDTEITKLLLNRSANVNYKNYYGMTALHFTVSPHSQETIYHLPNESELNFKNFEPCTNNASIKGYYFFSPKEKKSIPHGLAVCYYIGYTNFLVEKPPRVKSNNGTVFINDNLINPSTFQNKSKESNTEIIEMLLNYGADINASLDNGKTPLHLAVECGHIGNLQSLLNYKPNVDCSCTIDNDKGYTPLHLAVKTPNEKMIDMILNFCSRSVHASTTNGITALHSAVKYGHVQNVKELLKYKPDVNFPCSVKNEKGYTPLHLAAEGFSEEIVEMLLNSGCEINSITERGLTPLHVAAKFGRIGIVKILLQYNSDVNYKCNLENEEDYTALHFAAKGSNEDIIEMLLSSGSCVNATTKNGKTPLILAVESGQVKNVIRILKWNADVNNVCTSGMEEGYTALHFAARGINENIVEILLNSGVNVTAFAKNGKTALHLAVESNLINNVKHFLKHKQDVNISCNSGIHEGYTTLHFAAKHCSEEMIEILLKYGGYINSITKNGKTPLYLAVEYDRINNVKCLLTHNADVNHSMASSDKEDFIRYVFNSDVTSIQMIEKLLQNQKDYHLLHFYPKELTNNTDGFNVVVKYTPVSNCSCVKENRSSYTPIHFSIKGCSDEIALLLRTKNMHFNATNELSMHHRSYDTIGKFSTEHCCHILKYIPDSNCSCSSRFSEGYTPLHFAAKGSNEAITEILLNNGADFNACTSNGETALCLAVHSGHIQNVNMLLKYKPDVNLSCTLGYHSGYTPLHLAAARPDNKILELLLNNGANINACTSSGETPLFPAVKLGLIENIQVLLKHQPDVNDENNKLAFLCAVINTNTKMSNLFENYGFNISHKDVTNVEVLSQAIVKKRFKISDEYFRLGVDVNSKANSSEFLIHIACRSNNDKVFKRLLEHNVDVNVLNARGYAPLHILTSNKRIDLMKEILDYGADVNLKLFTELRHGPSALNVACNNYDYSNLETEKCIKLLLEYKADLNSSGEYGEIPICKLLSLNNSYDMVKLFLELGADVNKRGKDGDTALHIACKKCSKEDDQPDKYINLLLSYGADVTLSNSYKYTPLHVACDNYLFPGNKSHKLDQLIFILLENGSDLTVETYYKQTPVQLYLRRYLEYRQYHRVIPQKFILTTLFLIEQLVMRDLSETASFLIEQIFRNNYLYSEEVPQLCTDLRSHFSKCEKEITNLKNERIKGVRLYDILIGSVQRLATHETEDVNTFFEYNIKEKFPIYSNNLVNNTKKAKQRQD